MASYRELMQVTFRINTKWLVFLVPPSPQEGQKSAISGHRLQWILLNFLQWIFSVFSRLPVQFRKEIGPNCGENCPISRRRKSAESCHVSGCDGFFWPRLLSSKHKGRQQHGLVASISLECWLDNLPRSMPLHNSPHLLLQPTTQQRYMTSR